MWHTIIWHGRLSLNLNRLRKFRGALDNFKIVRDAAPPIGLDPISKKVNGMIFGYMNKTKEELPDENRYFAVRVEDIVLENPVTLLPPKHMDGKRYGPNPSLFRDESAMNLLKDIMGKNPTQHGELMKIYNRYFP